MAIWYVAPTIGANAADPLKHPVNGDSTRLNAGESRLNPTTFVDAASRYAAGDIIMGVASNVPHVLPMPTVTVNGMSTVIKNRGALTVKAESKGPQAINPYGDGRDDYLDRFTRTFILAGFCHTDGRTTPLTFENVHFTLRNSVITHFPDITQNETWDDVVPGYWTYLCQSVFNENGVAIQLNNLSHRAILRVNGAQLTLRGCEFSGGYGPNLAQDFNPNIKYPDYNSTAWGDTTIYKENNFHKMPVAVSTFYARDVIVEHCHIHDVHTALLVLLSPNAGLVNRYNCFERAYNDNVQVSWQGLAQDTSGQVITYGNILLDSFGDARDNFNPHVDGLMQHFVNRPIGTYGDDNPFRIESILSFNNLTLMRGRAYCQRHFIQGTVNPTVPTIYDHVSVRNELGVGMSKAIDMSAYARTFEYRKNIMLNTPEMDSAALQGTVASMKTIQTAVAAIPRPQIIDNTLLERIDSNIYTRTSNVVVAGDRGIAVPYTNVFPHSLAFSANPTVADWWSSLKPKAPYTAIGTSVYPTFHDWRYEDGQFTAGSFEPRLIFFTSEDTPLNTVVTSEPARLITNVMPSAIAGFVPDTVPLVVGAGLQWLEMIKPPLRPTVAADGTFTLTSHGFANDTPLRIVSRATGISGMSTSSTYYVVNTDINTFQLATSVGGAPVTFTGVSATANYAHVTTPTNISQDWSSANGSITGSRWVVYKGTSAALPSVPTTFTATVGGRDASWTVTTASVNVWPSAAWANTNRIKKVSFGTGLVDSQQGWIYLCLADNEPGVAKTVMSAVTGFAPPLTVTIGTDDKVGIRLWTSTAVSITSHGTVSSFTRDGTPFEVLMAWDLSKGTAVADVLRMYSRQNGSPWTREVRTGNVTTQTAVGWSTTQTVYIFGTQLTSYGMTLHALAIGDDMLDLWNDPTLLSKIEPEWAGKNFKGWTGKRPLVAFVGRASDLNSNTPVSYGSVQGWRLNTPTPFAATAGASQIWPLPLTLVSEVDASSAAPYVDGKTVNVRVRPIGYAEPFNVTPSGTDGSGPVTAVPEGVGGAIVPLVLTGPAVRSITFSNDSGLHINPAPLLLAVEKHYPLTVTVQGYDEAFTTYLPVIPA